MIFTSALSCSSRSLSLATLNDRTEAVCREEGFQYLDLTKKFESAPGVVYENERSSLHSKNLFTISMYMLQIGALVLLRRLVEVLIL